MGRHEYDESTRLRLAVADLADDLSRILSPADSGTTSPIFITLSNTCGFDGGYPYLQVTLFPLFNIVPGSGYTTITLTPGAGPSGSVAPVLASVLTSGKLTDVTVTSPGTGWYLPAPNPTVTVTGDGSGAAVTPTGVVWNTVGPSGRRAYEIQGNRTLPSGGIYQATVDLRGLLVFQYTQTVVPCVVSSSFSAASGTSPTISPGVGQVYLSSFGGGFLSTGTSLIAAYSNYTTTIPSGKAGWLVYWNGQPFILVSDC